MNIESAPKSQHNNSVYLTMIRKKFPDSLFSLKESLKKVPAIIYIDGNLTGTGCFCCFHLFVLKILFCNRTAWPD